MDISPCALSGIKAYYTGSLAAESYNLYKDRVSVVTGYASGATYSPGDSASHSYTVVAVNSNGTMASNAMSIADATNAITPSITCNPGTCTSATSVILTTEQGQTNYQWYKGGVSIGGATTYTYTATTSGTYTVSYTGGACASNLSAGKVVTISGGGPQRVAYSITPTKVTTTNHGHRLRVRLGCEQLHVHELPHHLRAWRQHRHAGDRQPHGDRKQMHDRHVGQLYLDKRKRHAQPRLGNV